MNKTNNILTLTFFIAFFCIDAQAEPLPSGKQEQYQRKIEDYNKAIRTNPKSGLAYFDRASAYNQLEKYQKAIDDCRQAIRLDSKLAGAYVLLGIVYNELGQPQETIDNCNRAIRLNPKAGMAFTQRGEAYKKLGQFQKTIDDCTRAVSLNSDNHWAYRLRANVYKQLGQYQKTIEDCDKLITLHPGDKDAHDLRIYASSKLLDASKPIAQTQELTVSPFKETNKTDISQAPGMYCDENVEIKFNYQPGTVISGSNNQQANQYLIVSVTNKTQTKILTEPSPSSRSVFIKDNYENFYRPSNPERILFSESKATDNNRIYPGENRQWKIGISDKLLPAAKTLALCIEPAAFCNDKAFETNLSLKNESNKSNATVAQFQGAQQQTMSTTAPARKTDPIISKNSYAHRGIVRKLLGFPRKPDITRMTQDEVIAYFKTPEGMKEQRKIERYVPTPAVYNYNPPPIITPLPVYNTYPTTVYVRSGGI